MDPTQHTRRVVWTRFARQQLAGAADFIELESPVAAVRLIERADQRAASLALFAERGRLVTATDRGEIREVFLGPYRLIYRVGGDVVVIRAFVHGARDWQP